jgi:hypothetical protein
MPVSHFDIASPNAGWQSSRIAQVIFPSHSCQPADRAMHESEISHLIDEPTPAS